MFIKKAKLREMVREPEVSVVMPVYNAEKYLQKAIDSILNQTFNNFELILINDCSVDRSEAIIQSYTDKRIIYLKHEKNKGVVAAANLGLQNATAIYTCVMHADDIALPTRIARQKKWLDANKRTSAVACYINFIDEADSVTGVWKEDRDCVSSTSIKNKMPWLNCIAHPTVMIRSKLYKKYGYFKNQQSQEDYDLWLRMLADGLVIDKIPEILLHYRVHQASITGTILRKANPFFKQYDCKIKFLKNQLSTHKWGVFETKVLFTALHDSIMGTGKIIKRRFVK